LWDELKGSRHARIGRQDGSSALKSNQKHTKSGKFRALFNEINGKLAWFESVKNQLKGFQPPLAEF